MRRNSQNGVTSWTPVRSMMDEFLRIPDLWDDAGIGFGKGAAADMWEEEDKICIKMSLPGVDPDSVDISIENNVITIRGEIKDEIEEKKKDFYQKQIRYGNIVQSFSLPSGVTPDNALADFKNGMLLISIPKTEETKPKQIKLTVNK